MRRIALILALLCICTVAWAVTGQDLQHDLNVRTGQVYVQKAEVEALTKVLMGEQAGLTKAKNFWQPKVKALEDEIVGLKEIINDLETELAEVLEAEVIESKEVLDGEQADSNDSSDTDIQSGDNSGENI